MTKIRQNIRHFVTTSICLFTALRPSLPSPQKQRFYAQLYRQHIHRASHSGGSGCGGVLAEDERGVQGRTRGGAGVDQRPDAVCALGRRQPNAV